MHILISNDDGVHAPGITALTRHLEQVARVSVVAPDRDRSGSSSSLTLDLPVPVSRIDERTWRVAGTPTDCVHLAVTGLFGEPPDMVVSGVNSGANMGDDVLYSGTVAAAIEGRFLGLPAIAVSLVSKGPPKHFDTAAQVAVEIVRQLLHDPLPADNILNVNLPDVQWADIEGFEVTRLGRRHVAEPAIPAEDPRGRKLYWIGPAGAEQDAGPGTDFHAVRHGSVSITPMHIDLTSYRALEKVSHWVAGLSNATPDGGAL